MFVHQSHRVHIRHFLTALSTHTNKQTPTQVWMTLVSTLNSYASDKAWTVNQASRHVTSQFFWLGMEILGYKEFWEGIFWGMQNWLMFFFINVTMNYIVRSAAAATYTSYTQAVISSWSHFSVASLGYNAPDTIVREKEFGAEHQYIFPKVTMRPWMPQLLWEILVTKPINNITQAYLTT